MALGMYMYVMIYLLLQRGRTALSWASKGGQNDGCMEVLAKVSSPKATRRLLLICVLGLCDQGE